MPNGRDEHQLSFSFGGTLPLLKNDSCIGIGSQSRTNDSMGKLLEFPIYRVVNNNSTATNELVSRERESDNNIFSLSEQKNRKLDEDLKKAYRNILSRFSGID